MELNDQPITKRTVKIYSAARTCDWCGQIKTTKRGQDYLYQYSTADDGRCGPSWRPSVIKGLFCSIECLRCYHS